MHTLESYGWNDNFAQAFKHLDKPECVPARVLADFGSMLKLVTPDEKNAELSGRLLHFSKPADLPKVGDWVAVQLFESSSGVIEAVVPRKSEIARKAAGEKATKQVMAANVDIAFVLQALDNDFNPQRLERYLYQLQTSNITPIIVLNKADQAEDISEQLAIIDTVGVSYIVGSALTGEGVDEVQAAIKPGMTAVLLGSSGVGKSTLTNRLLGEEVQKTQAVRESDSKGRHTTTHRELFVLENGGMLIDTPGIRELQLWGTEEDLDESYDDITLLTSQCRFSNCSHSTEPGCAIRQALEGGALEQSHYDNYLKMKRELQHLKTRTDPELLRQKKRAITKVLKQHYKDQKNAAKENGY